MASPYLRAIRPASAYGKSVARPHAGPMSAGVELGEGRRRRGAIGVGRDAGADADTLCRCGAGDPGDRVGAKDCRVSGRLMLQLVPFHISARLLDRHCE